MPQPLFSSVYAVERRSHLGSCAVVVQFVRGTCPVASLCKLYSVALADVTDELRYKGLGLDLELTFSLVKPLRLYVSEEGYQNIKETICFSGNMLPILFISRHLDVDTWTTCIT
jgi:hypothetical protein